MDRLSVDLAVKAASDAASLGIPVIALFPYTDPKLKTADGREALNPDNLICRAVRAIKKAVPEIGILCDVALDPYTTHGHDGLLEGDYVVNDETVDVLVRQAVVQVEAGCDIIAPSDMMDGRVAAISALPVSMSALTVGPGSMPPRSSSSSSTATRPHPTRP